MKAVLRGRSGKTQARSLQTRVNERKRAEQANLRNENEEPFVPPSPLGEAIQIVALNEAKTKLIVKKAAIDFICKQCGDMNVSVVSICGESRTGKSTFLNLLLASLDPGKSQDHNFSMSCGKTKACTEGIWMWSKPIELKAAGYDSSTGSYHPGHVLLLVDTEGTDVGDDNVTAQLISTACILSSLFIQLVDVTITNHDVDWLTSILSIIAIVQDEKQVIPESLEDLFPRLAIRRRDVHLLDLIQDGLVEPEMLKSSPAQVSTVLKAKEDQLDEWVVKAYDEESGSSANSEKRKLILKLFKKPMLLPTLIPTYEECRELSLNRKLFGSNSATDNKDSNFFQSLNFCFGRILDQVRTEPKGNSRGSMSVSALFEIVQIFVVGLEEQGSSFIPEFLKLSHQALGIQAKKRWMRFLSKAADHTEIEVLKAWEERRKQDRGLSLHDANTKAEMEFTLRFVNHKLIAEVGFSQDIFGIDDFSAQVTELMREFKNEESLRRARLTKFITTVMQTESQQQEQATANLYAELKRAQDDAMQRIANMESAIQQNINQADHLNRN